MDLNYNKNEDQNKLLSAELRRRLLKVYAGGGEKSAAKQREKGKMLARERVDALLDKSTDALEIGAFAAEGMYAAEGGCTSAGVIVKMGKVNGRMCVIVANDATVKAGAWFPMTAKKNLRAQEIAIENRIPIIYLVDSAGVYLPMQDEIFPDKEHFGRIFYNNARMSALGIVQIAAIMGSCVAGGAYLPIMSDEAMIVEGTGSVFLAGSYLVKSAIGETVDNETLGGANTHATISGVTDYKCANDSECLQRIKEIMGRLGDTPRQGYNRIEAGKPARDGESIYGILPAARDTPYDMREMLEVLLDANTFEEYKKEYGQTIICGLGRIDGWSVGIVANQRKVVKSGKGEMQFGGVIYSDSADKAARFIMNCNQKLIPLVFLHDVSGFMVGSRSEHGGIIKDGAKMVSAVSNSVVPKFSIIVGNSYGAGNYAMCGKAFNPSLIYAWPSAKLAVMGGAQAAKTLMQIQEAAMARKGEAIQPEESARMLEEITGKYNEQTTPYYAAARLWVDGIINPTETRKVISAGIEAANHKPVTERFNVGIIQT